MTLAWSTTNGFKTNKGIFLQSWYYALLCFPLLFPFLMHAQQVAVKDEAFLFRSENTTSENYLSILGKRALIYNGIEYIRPSTITKGHPFFESDKDQKGNVSLNGILYNEVPILFDIVSGVLTTVGYQQIRLQLPTENINYFTLQDRLFIPLPDQPGGNGKLLFFEVLYQHDISVLAHHRKYIERAFRAEDPPLF